MSGKRTRAKNAQEQPCLFHSVRIVVERTDKPNILLKMNECTFSEVWREVLCLKRKWKCPVVAECDRVYTVRE